jgi:hypothetical protein
MASITIASTTVASIIANKGTTYPMKNQQRLTLTLLQYIATNLKASLSLPQPRVSLSTLLKYRVAVSSSANTSAPLGLSMVLAQSHLPQSVSRSSAILRLSLVLVLALCLLAPPYCLAQAPFALPTTSGRVCGTFICLWRTTLGLPTTSRRVCGAFLCLRWTTFGLPTTFSLTFGFLDRLFFNTLRSCFFKVLIAHDIRLP